MSDKLRSAILRIAADLPKGDATRRELLAALTDRVAMNSATVEVFLLVLMGALTQWDMRESKKRGYNPYGLSHMMGALGKVKSDVRGLEKRDDPEAMEALKRSINSRFIETFSPVRKTVKQIDAWLTDGKMPNYKSYRGASDKTAGPDLDDAMVIQDSRRGYSLSSEGKFIGDFGDWDDAFDAAKKWMRDNRYWPDVYYVNERGNVSLLDGKGNEIRSWV